MRLLEDLWEVSSTAGNESEAHLSMSWWRMRNTDELLAFGEPSWDDFPRPEQEQPAHFEDSMMQSVLGFVILSEREAQARSETSTHQRSASREQRLACGVREDCLRSEGRCTLRKPHNHGLAPQQLDSQDVPPVAQQAPLFGQVDHGDEADDPTAEDELVEAVFSAGLDFQRALCFQSTLEVSFSDDTWCKRKKDLRDRTPWGKWPTNQDDDEDDTWGKWR
ncbi:unnamed protein product, partial [Cladocopium goreaui]